MQKNVNKITMYSRPTCPLDAPVKKALVDVGVSVEYVDIRTNIEAKVAIREINNGYESVPTLLFPDGTTLTEPSPNALQEKLSSLGLDVSQGDMRASYLRGMLRSPLGWLQIGVLLAAIWGVLRLFGII